MKFIPVDEEARNVVRQQLSVSLAVVAGAGTGKTTLLIDRIIRLLTIYELKELAAITFTEKAAGELLDRLRQELERGTKSGSPLAGIPLRRIQALGDLSSSHISTIHSFASAIIRAHAFDLGIDPDFEHLDNIEQKELLNQIFISEFSAGNGVRDRDVSRFTMAGGSLSKLVKLGYELCDQYELLSRMKPETQITVPIQEARVLAGQLAFWIEFGQVNCLDSSDRALSEIVNLPALGQGKIEERIIFLFLKQIANINLTRKGKKENWKSGKLKELRDGVIPIKEEAKSILFQYRASILERMMDHLKSSIETLHERKRKKGMLTFHDQLFYAARVFQDHALRDEVSRKFGSLLIDEFQDTDPIQAEIALSILNPIKGSRTHICVVGDAQQSIYRFRRADPKLFRKVTDQIAQVGSNVTISQNFRSASGIIDFVNEFFGFHWGKSNSSNFVALKSLPDRASPPPIPSVEYLEVQDFIDLSSLRVNKIRKLEADAIAEVIQQAVGEKWQVLDIGKGQNELRDISWADIVILMPVRTDTDIYTDALSTRRVPFRVEGGKGLFTRQFAIDVLNVIRAIDNPADSLAVVAAIRSSLFGVNDEEIAEWGNRSENRFDIFAPSAISSLHLQQVIGRFRQWSLDKFTSTPINVLNSISMVCSVEENLLSNPAREIDRELWNTILGLARQASLGGKTLREFRKKFEQFVTDKVEGGGTDSIREGDHVRLMTIHSAKGLEFPMVILANFNKPRSIRPGVIADRESGIIDVFIKGWDGSDICTRHYPEAEAAENEDKYEELKRLLYVAMTRARDHLVISRIHDKKNPYSEWYEQFETSVNPREACPVRHRIVTADSPGRMKSLKVDEDIDVAQLLMTQESLIQARNDAISRLDGSLFRIVKPGSSSEISHRTDKNNSTLVSDDPAGRGRAIHSYMARCDLTTSFDRDLAAQVCLEEGLPVESIVYQIETLISNEFWKRALLSTTIRREIPLSAFIDGKLVRGVIDLIWEENGAYHIADYKTGTPDPARHYEQLDYYAEALKKCTGKPVAGKWLIYPSESLPVFWQ